MKNEAAKQIVEKLKGAENVLVALSKNPTVDELATAIALAMIIDKMGKRATTIYSGATPNALEFLAPEERFETNTNSLQDFIIAINKDKADHLRYKVDGDYVKVFITPYKTTIKESDLEFSYGEFNVDLVIALNVAGVEELDNALKEYGRILHDASVVGVTTREDKFGEVVWSEPTASSVAEMIAMMGAKGEFEMDKDIATALLTGIVAATERYSNEKTRPETMAVGAKLLAAGADPQLVSANMSEELLNTSTAPKMEEVSKTEALETEGDKTRLEIPREKKPIVAEATAGGAVGTPVGEMEIPMGGATETPAEVPAGATGAVSAEPQGAGATEGPVLPEVAPEMAVAEVTPQLATMTAGGATETPAEVPVGVPAGVPTGATEVSTGNEVKMPEVKMPEVMVPEEGSKVEDVNYKGVIDEALGGSRDENSYILDQPLKVIEPLKTTEDTTVVVPEINTGEVTAEPEVRTVAPEGVELMGNLPMPEDGILPPPPPPPIQF